MGKYLAVFKNSFQNTLIYRFNFFAGLISQFFTLGIFLYLWLSIYRRGGKIGSYSLVQLIVYYVASSFLSMAVKGIDVAKNIGESIRQGTITNLLLRPISHFKFQFFYTVASLIYQVLLSLALFVSLGILLVKYFNFYPSVEHLFYFILSAILGFLLNFLIFYIIGISTFWLGFIMGFNYIAQVIISFLDGSFIPLDLFPDFLAQINSFLPFKYIVYVPVSIFVGRAEPSIWSFVVPCFWIIGLYFISNLLFKKGVRKYEGFGL